MKKCIGIFLGILAACALIATVVVLIKGGECCPCKKVKEYFTEKDFTVLPMDEDKEV